MNQPLNCVNPVFIFGCARSGTSLLSRILNSHPNIEVPYESHLYNIFMPWLKYYGDLSMEKNRRQIINDMYDILHDWTPRVDREAAFNVIKRFDIHGIIDGVMFSYAQAQNKQRWGEKSPWHAFYWRDIVKGFPKAKFIHIVRDGRDSSASWMQARFGPKHYYMLAKRWKEYLEVITELKSSIGANNVLDVRYEDLLEDQENVTRQICDFIGEEYSSDMLDFHKNKTPYPTDSRNLKNLTKPLMKDNAQKWRKNLTNNDIYIFESVASKQLREYGYEVVNQQATLSGFSIFNIRYLIHPLLRLRSMSKNFKGQIDGLKNLFVYIRLRSGIWRL